MTAAASDLTRITKVFQTINAGKIVALANMGTTQSAGHEAAAEVIEERGGDPEQYSVIFWHGQSHDAFDPAGNLVSVLYLHWSGDRHALTAALQGQLRPFSLQAPPSPDVAFKVLPAPVEVHGLDVQDKVAAAKFLDQVRRNHGRCSAADMQKIRAILREGDAKLAIFAFQMGREQLDAEDVAVTLARVEQLCKVRPGSQMWQDPVYTLGWLLDALRDAGDPQYRATYDKWSTHRKRVYQRGAAKHCPAEPRWLRSLFDSKDELTRIFAAQSLVGAGQEEVRVLLEFLEDSLPPAAVSAIVDQVNAYREFHDPVTAVLEVPKYAKLFREAQARLGEPDEIS